MIMFVVGAGLLVVVFGITYFYRLRRHNQRKFRERFHVEIGHIMHPNNSEKLHRIVPEPEITLHVLG